MSTKASSSCHTRSRTTTHSVSSCISRPAALLGLACAQRTHVDLCAAAAAAPCCLSDYVMELAGGGEMYDDIKRVGRYSTELARFYAASLVDVLAFMHAPGRHVIHRDLKPENLFLTASRHLRVGDFGTARILTSADTSATDAKGKKRRGSFVGTAEYVSPEILRDEMPDFSSDLWSLGQATGHWSGACLHRKEATSSRVSLVLSSFTLSLSVSLVLSAPRLYPVPNVGWQSSLPWCE